jgi:hypothetical protein
MNTNITVFTIIFSILLGCGGKKALLKDLETCKKDLKSSQYKIEHLEERAKAMEAAANKPVEDDFASDPSLDLWKEVFADIAERFKNTLEGVDYELGVNHGALVISFGAHQLFTAGDSELHEEGGDLVQKLASVLKILEDREILITGRALDAELADADAGVKTSRELAVRRSTVLATSLEWQQVNPMSLIAAGNNTTPSDDAGEKAKDTASDAGSDGVGEELAEEDGMSNLGVVEIHILPRNEELPEFPKFD